MILLDSDVCIGILHDNQTVLGHVRAAVDSMAVPGMVVGELFYGVEKSSRPEHNRERTENLLKALPVHHPTDAIMRTFGRLKAEQERRGTRVDDADVLIAATALELGATLATGNTRHFSRFEGLRIENWLQV